MTTESTTELQVHQQAYHSYVLKSNGYAMAYIEDYQVDNSYIKVSDGNPEYVIVHKDCLPDMIHALQLIIDGVESD